MTYMRSGNTFLRKYLELITMVPTGTDMHTPPMNMQMTGLIGEEVSDDSVWVIKSHEPMRICNERDFTTNKIIITARNPFDVIVSCVHFLETKTHDKQIVNDFAKEDPDFFDETI